MKNEIQLFNYGENAVRTVEIDGEVWFVAKDICDILDYSNVSKTLNDHLDEEERNTLTIREGIRGNPEMNIINESGVYALIMRSNKPEAKKFRKWVTSVVIPSIRKTGSYSLENKAEPVETTDLQPVIKYKTPEEKYISRGILRTAKMIYESAGLKDVELTIALDKVFHHFTGQSALKLAGISVRHWIETENWSSEHCGGCRFVAEHFDLVKDLDLSYLDEDSEEEEN